MIAGYKEAIGLSIYPYLHMLAWPISTLPSSMFKHHELIMRTAVTVVISELHVRCLNS